MRKVTNIFKSLVIGLCMLVILGQPFGVKAGKIYKWVDKQGNVHYSSKPGPKQTATDNFSNAATRQRSTVSRTGSLESMLRGVWYGTLNGKSYQMHINRHMLRWDISTQHTGSVYPIFQASWKDAGGDIAIIYINHARDKNLNGQRATIRVLSKSREQMTLQMPDRHVYKLTKSISRRYLSKAGKQLLGHWLRQDGAEILFKSGSYFIKEHYSNRISEVLTERGNWKLEGDRLSMNITGGEESLGKQGTTKTYRILLNDGDKLILSDTAAHRQMTLSRKLK